MDDTVGWEDDGEQLTGWRFCAFWVSVVVLSWTLVATVAWAGYRLVRFLLGGGG